MLNKSGVTKVLGGAPTQILAFTSAPYVALGVLVDDAVGVTVDGRKIVRAGTPLYGNLDARTTAFAAETTSGAIKGVFTVQVTTAFVADDTLVIDGVTYTAAVTENVEEKKFTVGANIAAQVTSLLKMVKTENYDVALVADATDKIGFTQKAANVADVVGPTASKTGTGAIGAVTKVTDPVAGTSNAVGVLVHDIDVTAGDANGSLLIEGYVNTNRLDSTVKAKITTAVKTALDAKVTFLAV